MRALNAGGVRLLLGLEGLSFGLASLIHFGVLVGGHEHTGARVPEAIIAADLLLGAALTLAWTKKTGVIAGTVQLVALLGTLVGVAMIIAGFGPRTVPDVIYHTGILVVLAWGIAVSLRAVPAA
jgi:hypothetical protein